MWQCEDSHGSTRAEIAALLGQSLPVTVLTGKKSDDLGVKLSLHTMASREGLKPVCNQKQLAHQECALVPVAGEMQDVKAPIGFLPCPGWCFQPWAAPGSLTAHSQLLSLREDMRNRDLGQCCHIQAGYNRSVDLHRNKLPALGKSSSTASMLLKIPEQKTLPFCIACLASKVGITAL